MNTNFYHGFGHRSDMTDAGRRFHLDVHRAVDLTKLHIVVEAIVAAGRLHPRKGELYLAQFGTLIAQLTSDMALQDPGRQAEKDGQTDPAGQLRAAFAEFTRMRPENERDYAAIGRQVIETADRIIAATPPQGQTKEPE